MLLRLLVRISGPNSKCKIYLGHDSHRVAALLRHKRGAGICKKVRSMPNSMLSRLGRSQYVASQLRMATFHILSADIQLVNDFLYRPLDIGFSFGWPF